MGSRKQPGHKATTCLVRDRRLEVRKFFHDLPKAGDFGVEKTIEDIKENFYWPVMRVIQHLNRVTNALQEKIILVIMNIYKRLNEAIAFPIKDSATNANAIAVNFICFFGTPLQLHSDQGRNFEFELL